MRPVLFAFALTATSLLASGCASSGPATYDAEAEFVALEAERDSLRAVAVVQDELLAAYADSVRTLRRAPAPPRRGAPPARPSDGPPQRAEDPSDAASDTLYADELFAPASANLTEVGRALLDRVLYELGRSAPVARLRVEGHGDSTPPGPSLRERYPSNWELAAARASAVARYFIERGLEENRLEVVSLAATRPVASDDTPEGRARNRRVVVRAL